MLNLQGKVALVMGCGAVAEGWGNGRASATLLARQGAQVYGTDLQLSHAENTRDIVRAEGGTMEVAACDVTQAEQVNRVVDDCVKRFDRIDQRLRSHQHPCTTSIRFVIDGSVLAYPPGAQVMAGQGR